VTVELDADRQPIGIWEAGGEKRTIEDIGEISRIDDEWWRLPIHRRCVEAILDGGKRVVLFQDMDSGEWWMQKPA
jgi:hypothetical protein